VQFSSVPFVAKNGKINWLCRAPGGLEMRLWPENKGGRLRAKNNPFFPEKCGFLPLSGPTARKQGHPGDGMCCFYATLPICGWQKFPSGDASPVLLPISYF
jgi:hypothetical protein